MEITTVEHGHEFSNVIKGIVEAANDSLRTKSVEFKEKYNGFLRKHDLKLHRTNFSKTNDGDGICF